MDSFTGFITRCIPLVFGVALGLAVPAYAVHDNGLFELDTRAGVDGDQAKKNDPIPALVGDGNTTNEGGKPGEDWINVWNGTSSSTVTTFIEDTFANGNINVPGAEAFVALRTPEVDFFTGGGSKDTNGIQSGPWLYDTTNDQVPDKNDIVNAFAAAYTDPDDGHTIFYFGLDTHSVNGSSNAGFWFFRDKVGLNDLAPGADTGTFSGEHTDGDIFVAVAYSEGGRVGTIDVYMWSGNDATGSLVPIPGYQGQSCATVAGDDEVCGVINRLLPGQTFGEDPAFDYANTLVANNPALGDSYKYQSAAFVEFGLDITALFEETTGSGDIGCFSTFLAETRSSQSTTAQLKDFALGEFKLCGVSVTKACDGDAVLASDGSTVTVNWKATVSSTGPNPIDVVIEDINDSAVNSVFDAVCVDGDPDGAGALLPNGACGDVEDTPVTFTDNNDGTADFMLAGNETVIVEGHYVVNVPADPVGAGFDLDFDDYIEVTAYEPGTTEEVDDDTSSTVTCSAPDNPAISVVKNCAPSFTGGDTFTAAIDFRVVNTGNILLDTFTVSDVSSEGADTESGFSYCIDTDGDDQTGDSLGCEQNTTLAAATLTIGQALVGYDSYVHTDDGVTSHSDTVTVSALSAFTDSSTGDESDSTGGQSCAISPNPEVLVVKECDTSLGGGTGVDLLQQGGVLVVRVGAVITATNTGDEDIVITITDPKLTNLDDDSITNGTVLSGCDGTTTSCQLRLEHDPDGAGGTSGGTATLSGTYLPGATDDNQQLPSTADFTNLVSLVGVGTLTNSPVSQATGTDLTATCELCPPCPDCEE